MAIANSINTPNPVGQSGSQIYAASATGNDTYVITLSPVPPAYVNGMTISFKADVPNTAGASLNVNGLGAVAITKAHDQALDTGDIEANQIVTVVYNSTGPRFQMQSQGAQGSNNLTGTANQIDVTAPGAPQTASLSATLVAPGTVTLNADPVTALQAATKQYVDAVAAGLEFKTPVVCATTTALTVVYANGVAGVGATLTNAGALAAFSVDGITPPVGSRILFKNQAATFENGVYTLTVAGSGAVAWVATRATDYDSPADMEAGSFVAVETGSVNANTAWIQAASVAVVGTDPVTYSQFGYGAYTVLQNGQPIYAIDTGAADAYVMTLTPAPVAYTTGMILTFKAVNPNTTTSTLNVNGLGLVTIKKAVTSDLVAGDILAGQMVTVIYDGTNFQLNPPPSTGTGSVTSVATGVGLKGGPITTTGTVNFTTTYAVCGRLTFSTGVPVPVGDIAGAGATTIYYTPYKGFDLDVYSGAGNVWTRLQTAEINIAVPAAANQMYDIFVYDNAGVATLELTAWTNDTTRATALAYQNGVLCKSGALTRRYLGSFRTTGVAGQGEDSAKLRLLWNYYNRVNRILQLIENTASWTYTSSNFHQVNASANNQISTVVGVAEDLILLNAIANTSNPNVGVNMQTGIGINSTTVNSAIPSAMKFSESASGYVFSVSAHLAVLPTVGFSLYVWLEASPGGGTTTWYSAATGSSTIVYGPTGITGQFIG